MVILGRFGSNGDSVKLGVRGHFAPSGVSMQVNVKWRCPVLFSPQMTFHCFGAFAVTEGNYVEQAKNVSLQFGAFEVQLA